MGTGARNVSLALTQGLEFPSVSQVQQADVAANSQSRCLVFLVEKAKGWPLFSLLDL